MKKSLMDNIISSELFISNPENVILCWISNDNCVKLVQKKRFSVLCFCCLYFLRSVFFGAARVTYHKSLNSAGMRERKLNIKPRIRNHFYALSYCLLTYQEWNLAVWEQDIGLPCSTNLYLLKLLKAQPIWKVLMHKKLTGNV